MDGGVKRKMADYKAKKPESLTKDGLALVVGGLFILALIFAAYNYFNKGEKAPSILEKTTEQVQEEIQKPEGEITPEGATTQRPETPGEIATQPTTTAPTQWTANDYKMGDIKKPSYTVVSGDTLWEIAEGVYGNGSEWTKILDANKTQVGFLSSGQQALIRPGQVLNLP